MKLDALAGGETERPVGVSLGGAVHGRPRAAAQLAADRDLNPHHEDEVAVLEPPRQAHLLLVDAEVPRQHLGLVGEGLRLALGHGLDLGAERVPLLAGDVEETLAPGLQGLVLGELLELRRLQREGLWRGLGIGHRKRPRRAPVATDPAPRACAVISFAWVDYRED
jgi:hypothetical protein